MSLHFSDTGKQVAKIEGGKYNGKRININPDIHAWDETDFRRLRIANDAKFQHIPDTTKERKIIYITGPSGSGKSTYTRMFLEEYKKKYKDREIFLFQSEGGREPGQEQAEALQDLRRPLEESSEGG